MTPRCSFCGEFASENTQIHPVYDVCNDCIVSLIDNEAERRGVAEQERRFTQHWEGHVTAEDRERDQMREAGRTP